MKISLTEFKNNMNKYIELSAEEDIYLTSYGKTVAKLSNPYADRRRMAEELEGIAKGADLSEEEIREGRLKRQ